ncbi:MAG: peptide chain release factor N(5)-glutamine methyltransferase [Halieaceae bacterium]|nr:peptide chain release factor N(5)-glutamine methyltransferase [Halieaceae bacterium]
MPTVRELLLAASELPGDRPARDAEILLCHCLGKPRAWLYTWPEETVASECTARYRALLAERKTGQPVAYLTGTREFWSLRLSVNSATLIPRPDTETLVAWALELDALRNARVLDLGTGSGAIALAVASERPDWQLLAVDNSAAALQVARANAASLKLDRVDFRESNWFDALDDQRFDLLLSNPPYIDPQDAHLEQGDLRFEPRQALVATGGGLDDIRQLVKRAPARPKQGGWLLLEHGCDQADTVCALLRGAGFSRVESRVDLAGLPRTSGGQWRADG